MACLEMYNSEHKGAPPRISFSNDFVESHNSQIDNKSRVLRSDSPISTDFEFSVSHNSLQLSADELFSKGRILPMKDNHRFPKPPSSSSTTTTTTLRDELLAGDDDDEDEDGDVFSPKPPHSKARWKGFLSLRKSHIGSKKTDLTPHKSFSEPTNFFAFPLQGHRPTTPQGILREEDEDDEKSCVEEMEIKMSDSVRIMSFKSFKD
ncbi:hypothetical protein V2J09_021760 [Rumex salicifolius]